MAFGLLSVDALSADEVTGRRPPELRRGTGPLRRS
jgi:hypothetical protein